MIFLQVLLKKTKYICNLMQLLFPNVTPWPAGSASHVNLLEILILETTPYLVNEKLWDQSLALQVIPYTLKFENHLT